MSVRMIHWTRRRLLLICLMAQMFQPPSAEAASSTLNCSVTHQLGGSFRYKLSQRPASPGCKTCWEDENKTVIALDSTSDPTLVEDLTDQFIILRACHDYLYYTRDCLGVWEETQCQVNCSLYLDHDRRSNTGNSNIVFTGVIIGAVAVAFVLL